ncbi:MAG: hypothetical protein E2O91_00920 [Alphaproteobacteria bacterium]|nr:MAG: hypothetical protein E2O91_00920 [Alphaproteobacteria bacterium]
MTKIFLKTFAALFLLFASPAAAQEVTLDDFAWLAGQWVEERDDGTIIEINWAPPIGQMMVGTWQMLRGETLLAYENLRIMKTVDGFHYRLDQYQSTNNFSTPMTTQVRLVTIEPGRAVFEGRVPGEQAEVIFTIEVTEADELFGWAVLKGGRVGARIVSYKAARVGE